MTAAIARLEGAEAWDLIFPAHLAKLPKVEQEIMHRAMSTSSRVWVGYDGEKILAYWGVQPPSLLSDRAYLWLQTTEHLREHVFVFIRYSQRAVASMLQEYSILYGHTVVSNTHAIRWLRWLGAEFGPEYRGCVPFEIRAGAHHG